MSQRPFNMKNAKQKLTRNLNILDGLLHEAREFEQPWTFPTHAQELELFLISRGMMVKNLMSKLQQRRDEICDFHAECNQSINDLEQKLKGDIEEQFDNYWSEKQGEDLLHQAEELERKLERRLLELQCQEISFRQEFNRDQGVNSNQFHPSTTSFQQLNPANTWTLERRLIGNELKVPNFYGDPSEFDSFWELFQELAIIATLEKQGETINTTNMRTMVLDTFSKNVQDEMARKEFDSGNLWSMTDLLNNLAIAIRRREHVDVMRDVYQEERSIFHTSTTADTKISCTGCGQQHKFQYCNKYPTVVDKIRRLRELSACWKCFSPKHQTEFCKRQNCTVCGGSHSSIICRQDQRHRNQWHTNVPRQRYRVPFQVQHNYRSNYPRRRSKTPRGTFKSRSHSPNQHFHRSRSFNSHRPEQSPQRSSSRSTCKPSINRGTVRSSPSPGRTPERQVRFGQSPKPRRRSVENITVNLQVQDSQPAEVTDEFTTNFVNSNNVRLMVVPVQLQSPQGQNNETVLALLDSASDQSFISTSLVRKMNLKTQKDTTIVVNTFGGRAEKKRVQRVITSLYNSDGDHIKVELLTSDHITAPLQMGSIHPQDSSFIQEHSDVESQRIVQMISDRVVPEILIGMDYFNSILKLNQPTIRLPSGLFLTPTFFGPVISGAPHYDDAQSEKDTISKRLVHTYTAIDSNDKNMDISELWKLNTIGIEDMSTDEEINNQIIADFYSSVQIKDNKIFKQLNDNLYVDNVLLTDDSTQALIKKYQLSKQVFNNMSMNLRQFITNDIVCNKSIAPKDLSTSKTVKILGVPWDHQEDSFSIRCKLQYSSPLTKRRVLQATHSTFDPLGLLIPLLLPAKLFLQNLWKLNYKWDETLPLVLHREFQSICEQAAEFEASVPRALASLAASKRYEIVTFVDASIRSFAAACYLRTIDEDGTIRSSLLMARQRLGTDQ
ncbi:Pao retrotransposon peptidase [Ostertagia ostertagi]